MSIQVTKLGLKEKSRIFYFNTLGVVKLGKRNIMAILINAKFRFHAHSVLIFDIFK